jgi:hypothetical protein
MPAKAKKKHVTKKENNSKVRRRAWPIQARPEGAETLDRLSYADYNMEVGSKGSTL